MSRVIQLRAHPIDRMIECFWEGLEFHSCHSSRKKRGASTA